MRTTDSSSRHRPDVEDALPATERRRRAGGSARFDTPGIYTWTVPDGVDIVQVDLSGAPGGSYTNHGGGYPTGGAGGGCGSLVDGECISGAGGRGLSGFFQNDPQNPSSATVTLRLTVTDSAGSPVRRTRSSPCAHRSDPVASRTPRSTFDARGSGYEAAG